jgi:hypothetical protein
MLDATITTDWILKALSFYGPLLLHFVFLFAAGLLLAKFKNVATVMFFFGLLFDVITSTAIRIIIEFRLYESAAQMQQMVQALSVVSAVAYFLQVIGFFLFVLDIIEQNKNSINQ